MISNVCITSFFSVMILVWLRTVLEFILEFVVSVSHFIVFQESWETFSLILKYKAKGGTNPENGELKNFCVSFVNFFITPMKPKGYVNCFS